MATTHTHLSDRVRNRRRCAAGTAAIVALALWISPWGGAPMAQATDRVVAALTPPGGETNRFLGGHEPLARARPVLGRAGGERPGDR